MFQNLTFAQMEPFLWEWECNKSFCQPFKVGHVSCVTGRTEEPVEEKLPGRELGTLKSCFWEVFLETLLCSPAVKKKKKPKLLNKFDKTIKAEIDAAEKLRKKVPARSAALWAPCFCRTWCLSSSSLPQGKLEEALQAFERLVQQFPQSPRARYGKAQVLWRWAAEPAAGAAERSCLPWPPRRRTTWQRSSAATRCCREPSTPTKRRPSCQTPPPTSWERRWRDEPRASSSLVWSEHAVPSRTDLLPVWSQLSWRTCVWEELPLLQRWPRVPNLDLLFFSKESESKKWRNRPHVRTSSAHLNSLLVQTGKHKALSGASCGHALFFPFMLLKC